MSGVFCFAFCVTYNQVYSILLDVSTRTVVEVSKSPVGTIGGQVGGEVGLKKAASVC